MEKKLQKRNAFLEREEKDTAQADLEVNLKGSDKNVYFRANFYGSLDLNVTHNLKPKSIFFSPGGILSIKRIPEGVQKFYCSENLLESVEFPSSLEELNVTNNLLTSIDLERLHRLRILRISHNGLTELTNLPESLEELYCEYNNIKYLNLKNVSRLHTLHCNGNVGLELENIPISLVNTHFPPQVKIKYLVSQSENSKEYNDYVKKFFQYKRDYEKKQKEMRTSKKKPPCRGCGRAVGMYFACKDGKYQAHCGGTDPCTWQILIHRGYHENELDLVYEYLENVEEYKENVIKQKLNTLFEYIPEKESALLFEKQLKAYKADSASYKTYLELVEEKYFSSKKKEMIEEKGKLIQEKMLLVKEALRNNDMDTAVHIQYHEIQPLLRYIRLNTYEEFGILTKIDPSSLQETKLSDAFQILYQNEVGKNIGVSIGEKPTVQRFP